MNPFEPTTPKPVAVHAQQLPVPCRVAELAPLGHDLVQPVHAMQLLVQQLASLPAGASSDDSLAQLQGVSDTITSMFRNLLDYARLDAGAITPQAVALRVGPLVSRVMSDHARRHQGKDLRCGLIGDTAVATLADPTLLDRIIDQLLDNAFKYTPSGHILVRCRHEGAFLHLEVLDSGIGLGDCELGQAQRAFFRGASARALGVDGIGLGLTNATWMAQLMGGDIVLGSERGQGSRAELTLPMAA